MFFWKYCTSCFIHFEILFILINAKCLNERCSVIKFYCFTVIVAQRISCIRWFFFSILIDGKILLLFIPKLIVLFFLKLLLIDFHASNDFYLFLKIRIQGFWISLSRPPISNRRPRKKMFWMIKRGGYSCKSNLPKGIHIFECNCYIFRKWKERENKAFYFSIIV